MNANQSSRRQRRIEIVCSFVLIAFLVLCDLLGGWWLLISVPLMVLALVAILVSFVKDWRRP